MRIISQYRDYYDGAAGFYSDDHVVYVRKTEEIFFEQDKPPPKLRVYNSYLNDLWKELDLPQPIGGWTRELAYAYLFFAGRVYVFFQYNGELYTDFEEIVKKLKEDTKRNPNCWTARSAKEILKLLDRYGKHKRHATKLSSKTAKQLKKWYPINTEVFLEAGTPCFLLRKRWGNQVVLIKNPPLRTLGFQKKLDPYQCYQELDMFLGNQMAQQHDPVPERTDELIRDQHGFDQHSFRNTAPSSKKARRKKNKTRKRNGKT